LKVRDVSLNNTAGQALQITAGGALDVIFKSISAASSSKGISVNGSTGSFQVLGTGTTAGSGGTISNMTTRGAEFSSVSNITLTNMNFTNANTTAAASSATDYSTANGAITLNNVSGVTLTKIAISGTTRERGITGKTISNFTLNGGSTLTDCGDDVNEGCLYLQELTGTCNINNATLSKASENIARVFNSAGTLTLNIGTDVTTTTFDNTQMQNANMGSPGTVSALGSYCFIYTTSGSSTATTTLNTRNTSFLKAATHGFKIISDGSSTTNVNVKSCTFNNDNATVSPNDQGGSIELTAFNSGVMNYNILNNSCRGKGISLINIVAQINSIAQGRVNDNTVTISGTGSAGDGIRFSAEGSSDITTEVTGNTVSGMASGVGISATALGGDGKMNATIMNNTVTITDALASHNIAVVAGNSSSTFSNTTCANVANNITSRPDLVNGVNFRVRVIITAPSTHKLYLQGTGAASAEQVWTNNGNTPTGAVVAQAGTFGTHIFSSTNAVPTSLATCAVPANATYSLAPPPVAEVTTKTDTTGRVSTESRTAVGETPPSVIEASGGSPEGLLSGETVTVNGAGSGFTLAAGKSTTIKFRATINTGIAAGTCAVSTQGTVSSTTASFTSVLTDDPSVGGGSNPTSTTIVVAPTITTCQSNITATIAASACTSAQSFAAVATGCPTPTLTYKIGATTITSPFAFPVGTSTVDVTASNGVGTNATCSFTVNVTRDAVSPTTTNNALAFNGSNSVAISNCSGAALDVLNAITIEYWFKGSNLQSAVRLQNGASYIVAGWSTGLHIISSDGGTTGGLSVGANAMNGNWHHVAMTWQRNTVNGFKSYLDGQLVAQRTSLDVALPTINSGMFLGAFNGSSEFMTGSLDEVRVWNVARTQAEIQTNMMGCTALGATPNLVMYYQFNHGAADGTNSSINTMVNSANATTFPAALNGFTLTGSSSNWTASPLCTDTYTWTGTASTDWANLSNWSPAIVPSSTSSIVIPTTTNGLMLAANRTINQLTFTGNAKIKLDGFNLTVNSLNGGGSNAYVVTSGTVGPNPTLTIKNVGTTATLFPVGPSETVYAPATITNNVARDFSVKVGTAITNAAVLTKTVNLQWDITPSVLTGNSATLGLGWTTASQGSAFNIGAPIEVAHYNSTTTAWDVFRLAMLTGAGTNVSPYVATVSGVNAFSPFVVANQNALPIELLDFKGTPQYNGNLLTWTTASEVNNKGFNVERIMANGQWGTLDFVKSTSSRLQTSTTLNATYDFTDNQPLSVSYYRLRQMDNDGKETLSKVISVSTKGNGKLTVYPNPVSNVLTVEVERKGMPFYITNLLGQQVLSGKATPQLDVSALPKGAYFLRIGTEQVKFVKQ
jgi:Concanavalin A-like lectin/glucanases superfamily/Secretion system C-terminal sorting domain